jgi:transglutaminase-like putative cysteine protease|tara:strand:+ start:260 stop:1264 length:1005 start_codon:yes stop_codon:yes gene_type:complete
MRFPRTFIVTLSCAFSCHADGSSDFNPWQDAAIYEIRYVIDVSQLKQGSHRRLWIPLPRESAQQSVLATEIESPWTYRKHVDAKGNAMLYIELDASHGSATTIVNHFKVRRSPSDGLRPAEIDASSADDPALYLNPAAKIPLGGLIKKIAEDEGKGIDSKPRLIRTYYDYVFDTMTYSKEGEGWGEGDAIWACTSKYGNCTDFHSLFIGMARSKEIPARFIMGFPLSGDKRESRHDGYHCWADVFDEISGWRPLDISEAKNKDTRDAYYGRLPSNRIEFTVGRDLALTPPQQGKPLNYFIYPYAEVDGQVIDKLPVELHYKRLTSFSAQQGSGE